MLQIGRVLVMLAVVYSCLVSVQLPGPGVLGACYCLDKHCLLKSLVTPR